MPQPEPTLRSKQVEKSIIKGVKKAIVASGIDPSTRSGNKELSYLAGRLAKHSFQSLEAATQLGEALGQKIVALSQQSGKTHLDRSVIWQLVLQKQLPPIADFAADSPDAVAPRPTHANSPVRPAPPEATPQPQTEPIAAADEAVITDSPIAEAETAAIVEAPIAADEESLVDHEADEAEDLVADVEHLVAESTAADEADEATAEAVAADEDAAAEEPDAETEADQDEADEADAEEPDPEEVTAPA